MRPLISTLTTLHHTSAPHLLSLERGVSLLLRRVQVPYVLTLGGTIEQVGTALTLNAFGRVIGGFLVPILADKWSRKGSIFLSMIGSLVAYALAGFANFMDRTPPAGGGTWSVAIWTYILARLIGGLFGSTMSLCIAFTSTLTAPDMKLMKQRNSLIFTSNQAAGIALAPIGGALGGAFGLYLPFFFSSAIALAGLVYCIMFLKEKSEIVKAAAERAALLNPDSSSTTTDTESASKGPVLITTSVSDAKTASAPRGKPATDSKAPAEKKAGGPNPWCDPNILLMAANAGVFSMILTFQPLILPALLNKDPVYGISATAAAVNASTTNANATVGLDAVQEEVQKTISTVLGLLAVPQAACMLICQSVGYIWISRYVTNKFICSLGCFIASVALFCNSFTQAVWQIAICNAFLGVGFGTFLGACKRVRPRAQVSTLALAPLLSSARVRSCVPRAADINVPNGYIMKFLSHAVAQARAANPVVMALGAMAGPQVTSQLMGADQDTVVGRWLLRAAACGMLLMSVTLFFIVQRVEWLTLNRSVDGGREKKDDDDIANVHSEGQHTSMTTEQFESHVLTHVKSRLTGGNYMAERTRASAIAAVEKLIDRALPPLRPWADPSSGGREHLEDLAKLFYELGDYEQILALEKEFGIELHSALGIADEALLLAGDGFAEASVWTAADGANTASVRVSRAVSASGHV